MSASDEERLARLALSQVFEPGDFRIAGLANQLGGVRLLEMLRTGEHDLPRADVAARLRRAEPARQLEYGHRRGLRYVVPGDPEWPGQLDMLDEVAPLYERTGCPLGLWVRGPVRLDTLAKSVAIVGTRSATTYGAETAATIAADVGRAGYAVVSGAAYGIDVAAHRGALAAGVPTIAVLACGADRIYPPSHRGLFDILAREGAIVSELAPGLPPTRLRFLSRNRIIAGMALGTVVVEAARRSGAHNTATWTNRLSRPVMAVPGPITSEASEGVHRMLRAGEATVVTTGQEVLEMIAPTGEHLTFDEPAPTVPRDEITLREQQVLDAVPVGSGAPVDSLSLAAGMSVLAVQASLRVLQERGLVVLAGDGWRLTPVALRATGGTAP
jgi:DNA processing protein